MLDNPGSIWTAICGIGADGLPAPLPLGLIGALFLSGLVGSLGHCVGMCGPFVLAQIAARFDQASLEAVSECARLRHATLLPYHLGRATTYAALGAVAGGLGAVTISVGDVRWLPSTLLAAAALAFAAQATGVLGVMLGQGDGSLVGRVIRPLSHAGSEANGYGLGLALGFLPCGLLYAGLIATAGAGSALAGGAAMAALALGTAPMLIVVGYLGLAAGRRWLALARRLGPVLMLANATTLAVLAVRAWP